PPSRFRPDLCPDLERIVLKAMAAVPEQRYASAREVAEALDGWLEQPHRPQDKAPSTGSRTEPEEPVSVPAITRDYLETPSAEGRRQKATRVIAAFCVLLSAFCLLALAGLLAHHFLDTEEEKVPSPGKLPPQGDNHAPVEPLRSIEAEPIDLPAGAPLS